MKVLIVSKEFNETDISVDILIKSLKKYDILYDVIVYSQVEEFYDKIHNDGFVNVYDILISFGGDGTILKSARIARKLDIPILGINAGTIGFLASFNINEDIDKYLEKYKKNDYEIIERSMLSSKVYRNDEEIFNAYAVNETTLMTSNLAYMGKYEAFLGSLTTASFNEFRADGLIIATPTGSTGHSLSAGGPLVSPDVNCFILTAICPHAFNQRSIIISDDKEIFIKINSKYQMIDVDGRCSKVLEKGDIIKINKLPKSVKYIVFEKNHFINNIKNKIRSI